MHFDNSKYKISNRLKKEIARYAISFFFAWLVSALISDFPFFKYFFIQSIKLDVWLTNIIAGTSNYLVNLLGIETIFEYNFIKATNTPGVILSYGCLGFRELAFFVVFIAFQFGKIKHKLWYIPLGIILLTFLNIIRVVILVYGQYRDPYQFQIIHDIVSPIIMYPTILFLWLFWLNTFGKIKTAK